MVGDAHVGFRHAWLNMCTHPKPIFGKFLTFIKKKCFTPNLGGYFQISSSSSFG